MIVGICVLVVLGVAAVLAARVGRPPTEMDERLSRIEVAVFGSPEDEAVLAELRKAGEWADERRS